jgi:2-polyprenyl-6-methoxyphenol hydroxylase-like FAD-dependent oxidoreductase
MPQNGSHEVAPVVVAGGGVVGTTLALFLANHGIASVVLERHLAAQELPRAHAINPRSLEVLRELSIDAAQLEAIAAPRELTSEVRFVTTMTGHCFGTLPYERQGDSIGELGAVGTVNVPQPALESVLFDLASAQPLIDVRRGHDWVGSRQTGDIVTSTVRAASGDYQIESRFLIGADGAGSVVRTSLGISLAGPADIGAAVSMTFTADLTDFVRDRPGVLHWVFSPALRGVLLAYLPDRLWTYIVWLPPGRVDMSRFSTEESVALIRTALGPGAQDVPLGLIAVTPWTVYAQVANHFQSGNTFLVGDAAHRFPPTGGLGLNTGIQDAHNLAWKLAAVIKGWAPESFLGTYESERQPIGRRNAEQSLKNLEATEVLDILAEASHADDVAVFTADPARRAQIASAVEHQRPHFDSVALQLGYSYDNRADPITDVTDFVPRAVPGRRLPHGWLELNGIRTAVIDLISHHGFTVLLLNSDIEEPAIAVDAPVSVVRVDQRAPDVTQWMSSVGLHAASALLIRPDGHILAVAETPDEVTCFGDAIASLLRQQHLAGATEP